MTRTIFDNAMVAHVWAQRTQAEGRSSNGNFYFQGPFLYSYGTHFLVGYALPDGRALLNSNSYSISTSRHQSYAQRAVRYQGLSVPNLTEFRDILEGAERSNRDQWATEAHKAEGAARRAARAVAMITREAPKVAKGQAVNPRAVPAFPHFGQDAVALILESLGLPPAKAATTAARALKTRESNRAKWKAAIAAAEFQAKLDLARKAAAKPLAELESDLITFERSGSLNARYNGPQYEAKAREVYRAAKAAKSKGWNKVAAACMAHYRLIMARVKRWPEIEGPAAVRAELRQAFGVIRAARAFLAMPSRELGAAQVDSSWDRKPARLAREACNVLRSLGLINGDKPANRNWAKALCRYTRVAGLQTENPFPAEPFAAELTRMAERAEAAEVRHANRARVAAIRAMRAAFANDPTPGNVPTQAPAAVIRAGVKALRDIAHNLDKQRDCALWRIGRFTVEGARAEYQAAESILAAAEAREAAEAEAQLAVWAEARKAAWIAGQPEPARPDSVYAYSSRITYRAARLEDSQGGALIRARDVIRDESGMITGGTLETSQGAEVPITHAIRAFRFLKLCRDKGQGWKANGKSLPVGHFKVDSVDSEGNFRAGCHRISWGEVARLAAELGLDHLAPENTTEPTEGVHA